MQPGEPLWARPANDLYVPKASCKYFCPTSFRYSSIALVASVFSLKMRCSFSPQRSTSDIIRSVKKSWKAKPMVGHHALTLVPQSSPAPRSLCDTPQGLQELQVILCEHSASPPAQTPSEIRNKPLGSLSSCTPTVTHPRPSSASPSVPLFGCSCVSLTFWAETFSPLLNTAVFGVQLHRLQTRGMLQCHELCPVNG